MVSSYGAHDASAAGLSAPRQDTLELGRHRRGFGWVVGGVASVIAGAAMVVASYLAPPPEPTVAATYTHTHRLELVDEHRRSELELGVTAPDSLWKTAEAYIADDLPQEPAERSRTLIAATDALAEDNGYCAPTVWAEQYPDRVASGSLERHLEEAPCEDGSPNPHHLALGTPISTESLDSFVEDTSRAIETPVTATVYEEGFPVPSALRWGGAALGLLGLAAAAFGPTRKRDIAREVLAHDPNERPPASESLYYGHAYLVNTDYLGEDRVLVGAAKRSVERKATRLNRLASALENGYVSSSLEDTVREAIGAPTTKRTARSYVSDLAAMGHTAAKRYLEMEASKDANEAHARKERFDKQVRTRSRNKARTPKAVVSPA